MNHKRYLGDSVYVDIEGGMFKLTTENGFGPSNTIFLEPDIAMAFMRYVEEKLTDDKKDPGDE